MGSTVLIFFFYLTIILSSFASADDMDKTQNHRGQTSGEINSTATAATVNKNKTNRANTGK